MISTDKVVALATETDMAAIRTNATVVRARFDVTNLKLAIEILEKMGCDNVIVELAQEQPVFLIPNQYEHPRGIFISNIGVTVVDMEM